MPDRPHSGPCPGAHPVPGGPSPVPDGHTVPCAPPPQAAPLTCRQWAAGWVCAALVLLAVLIGVLR